MTGAQTPGRPSLGSWLSYGLGSETDNLPTFVVMTSSDKGRTCGQLFFDYYWGNGFLPSKLQGVRFRNSGDLVPYLANPAGVSPTARRALLDEISELNARHLVDVGDQKSIPALPNTRWLSRCKPAFQIWLILPKNQNPPSNAMAQMHLTKEPLPTIALLLESCLNEACALCN